MDDTLTHHGRLSARTYAALERLETAGIAVIPVTAAPAGWCDQMARMWPVDSVIGENGGLHMRRDGAGGISRRFWRDGIGQDGIGQDGIGQDRIAGQLAELARRVLTAVPAARLSSDQPFRLTSLAFDRPDDEADAQAIIGLLRENGASATVNSLWILGWLGAYDKLTAARRFLAAVHGLDIDERGDEVLYVGDSTNDAPMFAFFRHTAGVSTIANFLEDIPALPAWITHGPGGDGFVEVADILLADAG
jgi:hypothetical protein